MFITDDDLKAALKDHLKVAQNKDLKPHWDSVITRANRAAYGSIVRAFIRRGHSKAQIDQYDDGVEYQTDIGVWWCLTQCQTVNPEALNDAALAAQKTDRRPELLDAPFTINYKVTPPDGTYGQTTTGPMQTTDSLFNLDPDDVRIGQPTVF